MARKDTSSTDWFVYCGAHRHYLVSVGVTGTTWTEDQDKARRYETRVQAWKAAEAATWRDHNPTPWVVAGLSPVGRKDLDPSHLQAYAEGYLDAVAEIGARLIAVVAADLGHEHPVIDRMRGRLGELATRMESAGEDADG